MQARVRRDGTLVAEQTRDEKMREKEKDPVVIDALRTKIKVLEGEIQTAHEAIDELEKERATVQEHLQKLIQQE